MDANVYQHFRRDERPFIDFVEESLAKVERNYAPVVTHFLNPREQFILETLIGQNEELKFRFFGGIDFAERKRAILYPSYYEPNEEDFEIVAYEIHYPTKFATLSHSKILGTLLSTGIKREYFGDILTDGTRFQVFLSKENASYVANSVEKIGKTKITLEEINLHSFVQPKDEWLEEISTVSSLRLDNLVSNVYNISRNRSKVLIESGKVQVNFSIQEKTDFSIDVLDCISVRGFGRIQIQEILGITKKEKIRIQYRVLRK